MPVDLRTHSPNESIDIAPTTDEAAVLKFLYANPNFGYTPPELDDEIEESIEDPAATLSHLHESGCVGKTLGGYYHAKDNQTLTRFVRSLRTIERVARKYPGTGFDEDIIEPTE